METSSFEPASVRPLPPAEAEYTPPPIVSAGSLIGRTFSTYAKGIVPLVFVSALFHLPSLLLILAHSGGPVLIAVADGVVGHVLSGVLAYYTFMKLSGKQIGFGQALGAGLSRLLPIIGVSIVVAIGTTIGMYLLVVPGVILQCMWFVALPAVVVERIGVFSALGRSSQLTSGSRWSIFGANFVVGMAIGIVGIVGFLLVSGGLRGFSMEAYRYSLWTWSFTVVAAPLAALVAAIAYHDLRRFKEGTNVDELTAIFE